MQEKSTYEVEEILKSMRPDRLQQFYKENSSSMMLLTVGFVRNQSEVFVR